MPQKISIPLKSVSVSEGIEFRNLTLGGALREFIRNNPIAQHAQISAPAAGESNITLAKTFCSFLQNLDFDASVIVGHGFVKPFVKPCPQLIEEIDTYGAAKVARELQHAVVKVNSVVFDLTFLRLGESYESSNSFSLKQFKDHFRDITSVAHLMSITPEMAHQMAKHNNNANSGFTVPKGMIRGRALASEPIQWFSYIGERPLVLANSKGDKITLNKGTPFSIYREENHGYITAADNAALTACLPMEHANALEAQYAVKLEGAPKKAIKEPNTISISMIVDEDESPFVEVWERVK